MKSFVFSCNEDGTVTTTVDGEAVESDALTMAATFIQIAELIERRIAKLNGAAS